MDKQRYPILSWERDGEAVINSQETLDYWIEKLAEEAKHDFPFSVSFRVNEKTELVFTVGMDISHLEFFSEEHRPPFLISIGSYEDDSLFALSHFGTVSEMRKRDFIPISDAIEAVHIYYQTGALPDNIKWT